MRPRCPSRASPRPRLGIVLVHRARLVLGTAASPRQRSARDLAPDTSQLKPVVITATKDSVDQAAPTAATTTITGLALRANGIATVQQALNVISSITTVQAGSFGATTSLFTRGGQSNYTLVLVDGAPVNDPGGFADLAEPHHRQRGPDRGRPRPGQRALRRRRDQRRHPDLHPARGARLLRQRRRHRRQLRHAHVRSRLRRGEGVDGHQPRRRALPHQRHPPLQQRRVERRLQRTPPLRRAGPRAPHRLRPADASRTTTSRPISPAPSPTARSRPPAGSPSAPPTPASTWGARSSSASSAPTPRTSPPRRTPPTARGTR